MEMKRGFGELELAGHDGGVLEGVAERFEEIFGAKTGGLDVFTLFGGKGGLKQEVCHAEDSGERRADLVIEGGKHLGMSALEMLHGVGLWQNCGGLIRQVGSYPVYRRLRAAGLGQI